MRIWDNQIEIYQWRDGQIPIEVKFEQEIIGWSLDQIGELLAREDER